MHSAICFAKQRVRSELTNSWVTTVHQLMNIQKLSQCSSLVIGSCTSCTFHVSNIIVELRNLIQMII